MEEVLTPREALRELLHDASEGLLGWDPIGPLKDHLGEPFRQLEQRLQALVGERYALPAWDAAAYRRHKAADRLAAASEAFHVVGWSREDMRDALGIVCEPLEDDPTSDARARTVGALAAAARRVDVPAPAPRPSSQSRPARKRGAVIMPDPTNTSQM